jgi:UDP-N-acetylglucosamine/UDP-N-acetylgalactosamine 4-epimerase
LKDLVNKSILVTGGAGFIGSNIVDYLVKNNFRKITVLDNLSTGNLDNIQDHIVNRAIDFYKGDITSYDDCLKATLNVDIVSTPGSARKCSKKHTGPFIHARGKRNRFR